MPGNPKGAFTGSPPIVVGNNPNHGHVVNGPVYSVSLASGVIAFDGVPAVEPPLGLIHELAVEVSGLSVGARHAT